MRKFGFLVAILAALPFLGCDVTSYSILLTNDTKTRIVTYTYNGMPGILGPLEAKRYEVDAWTHPPVDAVDQNGIASVNVRTDRITGDHAFVYARKIILEVMNTLPTSVTIRAGNFIDNDGLLALTIDENSERTAIIYTANPNFTITGNFTASFDINVIDLRCVCDNDLECMRNRYDWLGDIWDNAERRPERKMYVTIR